jgi:hypothetical protein
MDKKKIIKVVKKMTPQQKKEALYNVKKIEKVATTPLDNFQLNDYLPNVPIITYNELPKYNSIEQILPHNNSYAITPYYYYSFVSVLYLNFLYYTSKKAFELF